MIIYFSNTNVVSENGSVSLINFTFDIVTLGDSFLDISLWLFSFSIWRIDTLDKLSHLTVPKTRKIRKKLFVLKNFRIVVFNQKVKMNKEHPH